MYWTYKRNKQFLYNPNCSTFYDHFGTFFDIGGIM